VERESSDGVHEERFGEGRAAAGASLEVHRCFHRDERQRDELREAAGGALLRRADTSRWVAASLVLGGLGAVVLALPLPFWALVIATVWQVAGFLMVIYLAGLTTLPQEVLEAASVDGAGQWRKLWNVVLPLMRPTATICIFLTVARSFMTYDMNLTLTNGAPYGSTALAAMHVYQKAFVSQQFATGQAEALVLFVIVAVVSLIQVSVSRRKEVDL